MQEKAKEKDCIKTKAAFLLMNLTNEPLVAFYTILPFILRKELHINAFQLSLFVMLRPVFSSFSFFWGMSLNYKAKPNFLKNSLIAWIIARIPFLLFPFFNNFYYIFFAAAVYQLFYRAGLPAWTEIIKRKITDKNTRHHLFSTFSIVVFIESILLGLFIGNFLDKSSYNWKIVFFVAAAVSLMSLLLKMKIKVPENQVEEVFLKKNVLSPIKDIFSVLKTREDFKNFQMAFLIGGFALMLISPAIAIYSNDVLNLSYKNMLNARLILMGVGFTLSSYVWKQFLEKTSMNYLITWVLLGFSIYIFFLILAKYSVSFFYAAFFFYGIAQAGSMLLWNLSGIYFSQNQNSILFTSTNLLFLGIRGLIAPFVGSFICYWFGPKTVLFIGLTIVFYGFYVAYKLRKTTSYSADAIYN
ncbi:MAG: MFS transporter [Parachlamydiales bacterium]|nr:MFS transporter [Parachlamydiales bacterium]